MGTETEVRVGAGGVAFSREETKRLGDLEARIDAAGRAVLDAGNALRAIRDERLYLVAGWETFDEYCRVKWSMRRETVDRMLRSAEVAGVLEAAGKKLPRGEFALRPLAPLLTNPIGLVEVYSEAEKLVPAGGWVTAVMLERVLKGGPPESVVDAESEVISDPAPAPADSAPAEDETDWDAIIRGEIAAGGGSSAGGGGGGGSDGTHELTQGQRLSRLTKLMERIAVLADQARGLTAGLDPDVDAGDDDRAVALNEATGMAVISLDHVAGDVQAWFSGDEAGLPEPDVTGVDFPVEFKY